ncbi:maleate cis-trans isomerase family protein [Arthrobacter castelli]|uniref:maleate cis-trans isomerase family protein n=1 Tax=Arthrobacter castelli TaxID=271431 RepID=UPI00042934DD|nr:aspartate/glutamate racemase family protein [Arthrobacter castelli]
MIERSARIGMIVPSSNTCLEPQTYRVLGQRTDVTIHFARIDVTRIALDGGSKQQFDAATMTSAAKQLKTADVDVVAWNGTSGSWLGSKHDQAIAESITAATGLAATTSTLAYLEAFARFGLSRVGLISPYTKDVNEAIVRNYAAEGLEVVAEHHLGLSVNESFASVAPNELLAPSLEMAASRPDTIIYLCTNLYGAPMVKPVEGETGVPALDSVAVTLWRCLDLLKLPKLESQWGKLLG